MSAQHIHHYTSGVSNAASYLVSGKPWVTGSNVDASTGSLAYVGEIKIDFPQVVKAFTIFNKTANALLVHFDSRANANVYNQHHYVTLPTLNGSYTFNLKCKTIYISLSGSSAAPGTAGGSAGVTGSFELLAELTGIPKDDLHYLFISGSGINLRASDG